MVLACWPELSDGLGLGFACDAGRGAVTTITPLLTEIVVPERLESEDCAATLRTRPKSALPASNAAARQRIPKATPALRRLLAFSVRPRSRVTREASGPRFAAIAKDGATRHSSISARARAYSAGLPQTASATSSQQFSRSARMRLLSHQTAGW